MNRRRFLAAVLATAALPHFGWRSEKPVRLLRVYTIWHNKEVMLNVRMDTDRPYSIPTFVDEYPL